MYYCILPFGAPKRPERIPYQSNHSSIQLMRKLFDEFKKFINRGSVMDLAVGMIIGSAFTAIINSLVNSILKPLINWIPGADNTGALQTVLREAVTDADGNIVTEALILDWGAVISAIITFFCTAIVLFLIVKAFNKLKDAGSKIKDEIKSVVIKDEALSDSGIATDAATGNAKAAAEVAAAEVAAAEVAAADTAKSADATTVEKERQSSTETTEKLLKEIVELLKAEKQKS